MGAGARVKGQWTALTVENMQRKLGGVVERSTVYLYINCGYGSITMYKY